MSLLRLIFLPQRDGRAKVLAKKIALAGRDVFEFRLANFTPVTDGLLILNIR